MTAAAAEPKKRGGARTGAGRKKDPLKDFRTGALTAQRILDRLKHEKEVTDQYKLLTPAQKLATIFRLRDAAFGRPAVSDEAPKKKDPLQINVNIRRIGA